MLRSPAGITLPVQPIAAGHSCRLSLAIRLSDHQDHPNPLNPLVHHHRSDLSDPMDLRDLPARSPFQNSAVLPAHPALPPLPAPAVLPVLSSAPVLWEFPALPAFWVLRCFGVLRRSRLLLVFHHNHVEQAEQPCQILIHQFLPVGGIIRSVIGAVFQPARYTQAMDAACSIFYLSLFLLNNGEETVSDIFSSSSNDYRSIYEISDILGFQSAFYFSRVFKKVTGLSPRDYMKSIL